MKKLIIAFIPIILFSQESDFSKKLDYYHSYISNWVSESSDSIDRYLSKNDSDVGFNKTKVMIAYEFGKFSSGKFTNDYDFSLSLHLPRLEDKAKLELSKVNKTTKLFGESTESLLSKKDDKLEDSYNLAFQYSQYKGKKSALSFTGGVRFNKIFFEPYIGVIAGRTIKSSKKENFSIKNVTRFYVAGEIKDTLSMQYLYNYSDAVLLGWYGNIEYSSKSDNQYLISEFIWHKKVNDFKFYRVGFVSRGKLTKFKNPKKDSFELYSKYHNKLLNKDWLFYEVTPAIQWEERDNFKTSVGVKLKIGATFGGK